MEKHYPLTVQQQKLYLYQKMYPNDPGYNLSFLFEITGKFDYLKFKENFESVVNQQDNFKVNFEEKDQKVFQHFDSNRHWEMQIIELNDIKESEQAAYVQEYVGEIANASMNIAEWPLIKSIIFVGSNATFYMSLIVHHIIADAYTAYVLFEKWSGTYNSSSSEYGDQLPSCFESAFKPVNQKRYDKALEFFKNELTNFDSIEIKEIPYCRNSDGKLEGKNIKFELNCNIINNIVNNRNTTEFNFFVLLYTIFIHKIIQKDEFMIGIPLANRIKHDIRKVPGYFVNTLPLGISIGKETTINDLLNLINEKMFCLLRYQDFDISHLSSMINNDDKRPVINNSITYYKQALSFDLNDCQCLAVDIQLRYVKFPISWAVENLNDEYRFHIEFSDYFDEIPFENIISHIIDQVVKNPHGYIREIKLLADTEEKRISNLINSNTTDLKFENKTISNIFEDQVKKFPHNIAVSSGECEWSYKELDLYANRIANFLVANCTCSNVVVSVSKCNELIGIILGIFKAGKVYIPIDVSGSKERKVNVLNQLDAAIIITDKNNINEYEDKFFPVFYYEDLDKMSLDSNRPEILLSTNDEAYIIFTSGSSGIPKGVVIQHESLANLFSCIDIEFSFNENDVWTLFHSYGFDYSILEIFGALFYGGKLLIVPENICRIPDEFYKFVLKKKVTVLTQTPSYFISILKEDIKSGVKNPWLRYVFVGAEAVYFNAFKEFLEKYGDVAPRLYNIYGITETTVISNCHHITLEDLKYGKSNIIGKPFPNIKMYVADKCLNMLPVGIQGELITISKGVAKRYYKNNKLTQEAFIKINNENMDIDGAIAYKSGDLVKVLPNGEIEYVGRIDKQVQIRGYRVEAGEIEATINKLSIYKESIVIPHEFGKNDIRLIAYVIPNKGAEHDEKNLLAYLKNNLPSYMIPSFIMEIKEKPLTINGKLDVSKLKIPQVERAKHSIGLTPTQERLLQIWKMKVGNVNISVDDNFFDVGGTSLHIPEMYYEILEAFNISDSKLSMVDLFEYTTIKQFSKHVEEICC
jgi:amino acid adenylation domain-containing protein